MMTVSVCAACLYASCQGILSLYTILKLFLYIHSQSKEKKKKHDILIQLDLCVTLLSFLCRYSCQWCLNAFHRVYLPLPDSTFDMGLLKQVKALELQGVSAAEAGDLQGALQLFSQATEILPQRASAYNNRAQALRLRGDTAGIATDSTVNYSKQHGVRVQSDAASVPCQTLRTVL